MLSKTLWKSTLSAAALFALLLLHGCYNEEQNKIERGMEFARARLAEVKTDPLAGMAFKSQMEMGGDLLSYVASNMDEKGSYPPYYMDQPGEPWCVVIKTAADSDVISIEGYGDDLRKPFKTVIVHLAIERALPPATPPPAVETEPEN